MDPFSFGPIAAVLDLAYAAVDALAGLLTPFAGTSSAAAAVAVTTLLVRAALLPLGVVSARGAAAMRRIRPQMTRLTERYRAQPERLQRELSALYRREGVSPLSGLTPMLVQLPVVAVVYALFTRPHIASHGNGLLLETLAGVPLGSSMLASAATAGAGWFLVAGALALVLLVAAEWSRRLMRRSAPPASAAGTVGAAAALPRVLGILPFLSLVAAALTPLAASVYIAISALWGAAERTVLLRRYP